MAERTPSSIDHAGNALVNVYHLTRKHVDRALAEHAMTVSRVKLLVELEDKPLRMSALASELNLAVRSTMDAVASLEREGMVTRTQDPTDRRAVLVTMTPSGRTAMRKALRIRDRVIAEVFGVLDDAELAQLLALLTKLRAAVTPR